jgi:peptidoglycan-N-acetylglucosamine deacetylase
MNTILDILQKTGVRATIFATGAFFADPANQGVLQKMKAQGLEFANHTYDHNSADNWTEQDFISQLQRTEDAAQNIARVGTTKPYFRYPFLADTKYLNTLAKQGYYYIRRTCDGGDWREGATGPYVLARLNSRECKQNGSIIILHGYTTQTAEALEDAIKEYQAEGYEVTTVSRVLEGVPK